MQLPAPGDRVGHYRILKRIGGGSFGVVFEAEHGGRRFALKVYHDSAHEEWARREANVLLHLHHPNVVQLFSFGRWPEGPEGLLYLVLELVRGRSLGAWARQKNPSSQQVAELVLKLARALGEVHRQGVLHRDLKESNVMVRDADGEPLLLDFSAGFREGSPTATLFPLPPGTPEYRSPEAWLFLKRHAGQAGARYEAKPSDDWWALGVVLYRLLTGVSPFSAAEGRDLIEAALEGLPVPPHMRNPLVPQPLSLLCMRMFNPRLEQRHASEAVVCSALEAALAQADEAWQVPLRPSGSEGSGLPLPEPTPRPAPRRPLLWLPLAACAVVALLLVLLVSRLTPEHVGRLLTRAALPPARASPQPRSLASQELSAPMSLPAPPAPTTTPPNAPLASFPPRPTSPPKERHNVTWKKTLATVATCAVAGCASTPSLPPADPAPELPPFPVEKCHTDTLMPGLELGLGKFRPVDLRSFPHFPHETAGRTTLLVDTVTRDGEELRLKLYGRLFEWDTFLYGYFSQAERPDGSTLPICAELYDGQHDPPKPGLPLALASDSSETEPGRRAAVNASNRYQILTGKILLKGRFTPREMAVNRRRIGETR